MAEFRTISVVGLGKLGAPLAAVLARAGHRVIGVDLEPEPVKLLNAGVAPVSEPGLQACIEATEGRLTATTDMAEAVRASALTMIIVPTPIPMAAMPTAMPLFLINHFPIAAVQATAPHPALA